MSTRILKMSTLVIGALSLSACMGLGGTYPSNDGYGQNYPGQSYPDNRYPDNGYGNSQLLSESGTVDATDPNSARFRLRTSRGDMLDLVYDRNTRLMYQGQQLDPGGLERGDGIRVNFRALNDGRYYAQYIEVVRDIRGTSYPRRY